MPVPAGPDTEHDETEPERDREQQEHPLGVAAQPREEHRVLDRGRGLGRCGGASLPKHSASRLLGCSSQNAPIRRSFPIAVLAGYESSCHTVRGATQNDGRNRVFNWRERRAFE